MPDLEIIQGATFSHPVTVADTAGKSYSADRSDRFWAVTSPLTVTITDATTVTVSLTADETGAMRMPVNARISDRRAFTGRWDLFEVDGETRTRIDFGGTYLSRSVTDG